MTVDGGPEPRGFFATLAPGGRPSPSVASGPAKQTEAFCLLHRLVRESGLPEDDFLFSILESVSGKKVPDTFLTRYGSP